MVFHSPYFKTSGCLNPLWTLGFFVILAIGAALFPLSEFWTAFLGIVFFAGLTSLHPLNGISFLVLVLPFFLGGSNKPFIFLLDVFIYGVLASAAVHFYVKKKKIALPFKGPALFLILSALISLPLNSKELIYALWASSPENAFLQWLFGNPNQPLYYFRLLTNLVSGLALFYVVLNFIEDGGVEFLEDLFRTAVFLAGIVSLAGILLLFNILPRGSHFLSLSLVGQHEQAITAFAFNRQYFGQYLLVSLPFCFYFFLKLRGQPSRLSFLVYSCLVALFLFSLAASTQRSVYLVLFSQLVLFIGYERLSAPKREKVVLYLLIPFLFMGGLFLLDWLFLDNKFIERLLFLSHIPDIRPRLGEAAWKMFTTFPFLGVGLGQYFYFFPDFYQGGPAFWSLVDLKRGNAHSIYLQTLADQGLVGFLSWTVLVTLIIFSALRVIRRDPSLTIKQVAAVVLLSLLTWLLLGFFHHLAFDLRSMDIYFWILLGILAGLAGDPTGAIRFRPKWLILLLLLLLTPFLFHLRAIVARPISPSFQAGFYQWESSRDGQRIQWLGRKGVAAVRINGRAFRVSLSAPLPGIEKNPQEVLIWFSGKEYRIRISDPQWVQLRIPAVQPQGTVALIYFKTRYTLNMKELGLSQDDRDLGMMVKEIEWEESLRPREG